MRLHAVQRRISHSLQATHLLHRCLIAARGLRNGQPPKLPREVQHTAQVCASGKWKAGMDEGVQP